MIQAIVMHSQVHFWLHSSVVAPRISSYITYLRRQRYTERTQRGYTYCVAHFAHWLSARRISLSSLDEEAVRSFLEDHLSACDCPYPARRSVHEYRAALRQLLTALRADGAIGQRPASHDPTDSELALFEHYSKGKEWSTPRNQTNSEQQEGYTLISILRHADSGYPLMVVAGMQHADTQAGAEFLTNNQDLLAFTQVVPKDWQSKNCQIVLHNSLYGNSPGRPTVAAWYVW